MNEWTESTCMFRPRGMMKFCLLEQIPRYTWRQSHFTRSVSVFIPRPEAEQKSLLLPKNHAFCESLIWGFSKHYLPQMHAPICDLIANESLPCVCEALLLYPVGCIHQVWSCTLEVLALEGGAGVQSHPCYIASSGSAWATWDCCLKKTNIKTKQQNRLQLGLAS